MKTQLSDEVTKVMERYCYICHKEFFLVCGTPQVKVGGCCCGFMYDGVHYIRPVYAHLKCYLDSIQRTTSTKLSEKEAKKVFIDYFSKEVECTEQAIKTALQDKYKGYEKYVALWRKELRHNRKWLRYFEIWIVSITFKNAHKDK